MTVARLHKAIGTVSAGYVEQRRVAHRHAAAGRSDASDDPERAACIVGVCDVLWLVKRAEVLDVSEVHVVAEGEARDRAPVTLRSVDFECTGRARIKRDVGI